MLYVLCVLIGLIKLINRISNLLIIIIINTNSIIITSFIANSYVHK
jgi:hypothetical protein